ncbi:MAG: nucleotide exchange factor GrpE [Pseudomonadota bacterium]
MTKKPTNKVDELREVLQGRKQVEKAKEYPEKNEQTEPEIENLRQKLKATEEKAQKNHEQLLRVMAEFENYKKRTAKEKTEQIKFANEKLVQELLPIVDDLERVSHHVSEDSSEEAKNIMQGVGMVEKSLLKILKHFGLHEIHAKGSHFDPNLHEALCCQTAQDVEDDTVLAVHRKGYKLGDRVIRAAQVTVAKKQA